MVHCWALAVAVYSVYTMSKIVFYRLVIVRLFYLLNYYFMNSRYFVMSYSVDIQFFRLRFTVLANGQ